MRDKQLISQENKNKFYIFIMTNKIIIQYFI